MIKIAAIEEIAFKNKWIDKEQLIELSNLYKNTDYGEHIISYPASLLLSASDGYKHGCSFCMQGSHTPLRSDGHPVHILH